MSCAKVLNNYQFSQARYSTASDRSSADDEAFVDSVALASITVRCSNSLSVDVDHLVEGFHHGGRCCRLQESGASYSLPGKATITIIHCPVVSRHAQPMLNSMMGQVSKI